MERSAETNHIPKKRRIVFIDNTSIETQTVYFENGKIKVSPWKLEENHHIVADGNFVSQKGRMVTEDDGTSVFRPYAVGSGSRYKNIFCINVLFVRLFFIFLF